MALVFINRNTANLGNTFLPLAQGLSGIEYFRTRADGRGSNFLAKRGRCSIPGGFQKTEPAEHCVADLKVGNCILKIGKGRQTTTVLPASRSVRISPGRSATIRWLKLDPGKAASSMFRPTIYKPRGPYRSPCAKADKNCIDILFLSPQHGEFGKGIAVIPIAHCIQMSVWQASASNSHNHAAISEPSAVVELLDCWKQLSNV